MAAPRLAQLDGLSIDQDLEFQRRSWRIQRIGRGLICLLGRAFWLGLVGGGWPAVPTLAGPGLEVLHPRFLRLQAPEEIVVRLTGGRPGGPAVELWVDESLPEFLEFTEITPAPVSQAVRDGRPTFRFEVAGDAPAVIRLRVNPRGWGLRSGRLGLVGGPSVELKQFVYP